jgi:hypothetical protein
MAQLSINEAAAGFTDFFRFDYLDLQRSGFLTNLGEANQHKVGSMAPGDIITDAVLYQVTNEAGASNITLDFGVTAADPDEFIDNADVDAMTKVIYNTGDAFVGSDTNSPVGTIGNVINGYARNASTAANLLIEVNGSVADLTAGEWILAWRQIRVGEIAATAGA